MYCLHSVDTCNIHNLNVKRTGGLGKYIEQRTGGLGNYIEQREH